MTGNPQLFTSDRSSPVFHDTETMALASQDGHLFAATGQWEYSGPKPAGQVLVKRSANAPWSVVETTEALRVQAVDSFPIPADQGLGPGHSLLITQTIVNGRSELQWLLDGATSFSPADSFGLATASVDVRSFGAHESDGMWSVYAGANPTGVLAGTWSKTEHTLVFDPKPEVAAPRGASPSVPSQKVTAFAQCAGALYVTFDTRLYRRNDGDLPPDIARWVLLYQEPPVGVHNSGLRGLTCVSHDGSPSLLVSTEGNGDVERFDHLPSGRIDADPSAGPGDRVAQLNPVLEFQPIPALRQLLAAQGTIVPTSGKGSIDYVIAAYNNFESVEIDDVTRQLFGIEHAYLGGCPSTRVCGPTAVGAATFDAAACFAVRTDEAGKVDYTLRCLGGPQFTPVTPVGNPIRQGQAFVSIRTIKQSPFGDGRLYLGGYDCNFYPADGTAWVASTSIASLQPDQLKVVST